MTKTKSILHQQVIEQIAGIGRADILVGIPSFRNEMTIVNVVKSAKVFEDKKPYLVKRWDDAASAAHNDVCA